MRRRLVEMFMAQAVPPNSFPCQAASGSGVGSQVELKPEACLTPTHSLTPPHQDFLPHHIQDMSGKDVDFAQPGMEMSVLAYFESNYCTTILD